MGELDRFWRAIVWVATTLFGRALGWNVAVEGMDNLPDDGGAVLAFNHHGYVDVVMVAWGPATRLARPVRFLAKAELFEHWATRRIVRGVGAVPVHRTARSARAGAYAAAVAALRAGELVAVAPEQTISTSFDLLPFKPGAARMAIEAGVPLVPVAGWGSHRFATKGGHLHLTRRRLPVTVAYGEPLLPREDETPAQLTGRLREALGALLDDVQRRYPEAATGDDWWVPARLGGSAPTHDEVVTAHRARFTEREARGGRSDAA